LDCCCIGPLSTTTIEEAVKVWNRGYDNPSALVAIIDFKGASNRNDLKYMEL
jgi:hypothetical protein